MGKQERQVTTSTICPHCGTRCRTVRVEQVTALYREVVYQCRNDLCTFLFVASITPIRAICPSKTPNPGIVIPGSARAA